MARAKKKRADTHDLKLAIKRSFDGVIKVSVGKPEEKLKERSSQKRPNNQVCGQFI
jgi:hypothetical protein